jgi:hypothetical protein
MLVTHANAPEAAVAYSVAAEVAAGDAITMTQLARQHQTAITTCFRWLQRGLPDGRGGRVFLAAIRRGKKWLTSQAAVQRFFAALPNNVQVAQSPEVARTPSKRARATAQAAKTLNEVWGI